MKYMRDNTKDEYELKELQNQILKIAYYIDEICQKNNIEYYLMGGSALGAIRHKGFIPWDDDLDIFMKPSEYQRFREIFKTCGNKEEYYLQELSEHEGLIASAKLRLNNTSYIESASKNLKIHHGIFVDIFILHNTPDFLPSRILQCIAAKYILAKGQSIKSVKYSGGKKIILNILKLFPKDFLIYKSLKRLYKYNNKETKCVCHFMGKAFYNKGIYLKKYFSGNTRVEFEKIMLNVPAYCEEYLKDRFGNYMQLPSKDTIKKAQHAWKWSTTEDYSVFVNKEQDFSDEKYLV